MGVVRTFVWGATPRTVWAVLKTASRVLTLLGYAIPPSERTQPLYSNVFCRLWWVVNTQINLRTKHAVGRLVISVNCHTSYVVPRKMKIVHVEPVAL